jgi:hypothetical protein
MPNKALLADNFTLRYKIAAERSVGSLKSRQKSSLFPLRYRQALLIQCRLGQMLTGSLFFIRNSNTYCKRHCQ